MQQKIKPFKSVSFNKLPEKPRIEHPFFDEAPLTVRMQSGTFGDININYHVRGEGPPLLLLHGLMTTSYSWRYMISLLSPHFKLYIPDLPGCGRSDKPIDVDYKAESFATWVIEFQHRVGIYGCDCIGNSMAAYIAMLAALKDPNCFKSLVNIHSPGLPLKRLYLVHYASFLPGFVPLLTKIMHSFPLRWAHKNVHYYDETLKSLEEAKEYSEPLLTDEGALTFILQLRETMSPIGLKAFLKQLKSLKEQGKNFPVPLTMMYSTTDPIVPPKVGRALEQLLPQVDTHWVENTSHFMHVDSPKELMRLLPYPELKNI